MLGPANPSAPTILGCARAVNADSTRHVEGPAACRAKHRFAILAEALCRLVNQVHGVLLRRCARRPAHISGWRQRCQLEVDDTGRRAPISAAQVERWLGKLGV